jgi:hypothetical protein
MKLEMTALLVNKEAEAKVPMAGSAVVFGRSSKDVQYLSLF